LLVAADGGFVFLFSCSVVLERETDVGGVVDAAAAAAAAAQEGRSMVGQLVVWAAVVFLFSAMAWAIE
jgi:hypothetical protein